MSPQGSPPESSSTDPGVPGRRIPSWSVISGVVVLAAVTSFIAVTGGDGDRQQHPPKGGGDVKLLRARLGPMPPSRGGPSEFPANCGVSSTTLERVVPKRREQGSPCNWASSRGGTSTYLRVGAYGPAVN